MSDIAKRLRASVKCGAVNGNAHERAVCESQMNEAATHIERLERKQEQMLDTTLQIVLRAEIMPKDTFEMEYGQTSVRAVIEHELRSLMGAA